jgi:hypothetical protein
MRAPPSTASRNRTSRPSRALARALLTASAWRPVSSTRAAARPRPSLASSRVVSRGAGRACSNRRGREARQAASQKHAHGGSANIFDLFDFLPLSTRIGRSQTAFSSGISSAEFYRLPLRWSRGVGARVTGTMRVARLTSVPRGPPLCQKTPEIAVGQLRERRFLMTVESLGCEKRLLAALAHEARLAFISGASRRSLRIVRAADPPGSPYLFKRDCRSVGVRRS